MSASSRRALRTPLRRQSTRRSGVHSAPVEQERTEPPSLGDEAYSLLVVGNGTVGLGLELLGHRVGYERRAERALELVETAAFDAVIVDMRTSTVDGIELCRRLRKRGYGMALLVLLPPFAAQRAVDVFEAGADSCLVGAFALEELLARLRALFRRTSLVARRDGRGG
jgi:CheY-like chemotaxis protein